RAARWPLAVGGACLLAALAARTSRELPYFRNSETLFARALSLPPAHPLMLLNYGVCKFDQGEIGAAERCFAQALEPRESFPAFDFSLCEANLGYVRVLQGRTREAREVLRSRLEDPSAHWMVPVAWGMSLLYEGRPEEAIVYLEQARKYFWGDGQIMCELQRAYFEAGRTDDARALAAVLRSKIGMSCSDYAGLFSHNLDQWKRGGRAYAWRYFERLAESEWGRSVQLLNNAAWLAATDTQTPPEIAARAVAFAERAVEMTGSMKAEVLDTLGVARAAAGDFPGARQAAEQALAVAKDPALAREIEKRLALYRGGNAFRE
ncbi:MAG TPA: hypothetical protein DCM68_02240, partial [Verrucomicrobia bacterium]|nr:hypothetical protein [Verrucomicrobiota bacterium]